jgi:hypothetical protein
MATIPTTTRPIQLPEETFGLDPATHEHLIRKLRGMPAALRETILTTTPAD